VKPKKRKSEGLQTGKTATKPTLTLTPKHLQKRRGRDCHYENSGQKQREDTTLEKTGSVRPRPRMSKTYGKGGKRRSKIKFQWTKGRVGHYAVKSIKSKAGQGGDSKTSVKKAILKEGMGRRREEDQKRVQRLVKV